MEERAAGAVLADGVQAARKSVMERATEPKVIMVDDGATAIQPAGDSLDSSTMKKTSLRSANTSRMAATAAEFGSISGTVTLDGELPVDVCVGVYDDSSGMPMGSTCDFGTGGSYQIGDLPSGTYRVNFSSTDPYVMAQWYGEQSRYGAPGVVTVSAPSLVTGIDADLVTGGFITGTITDGAGQPVGDACAIVWPAVRGNQDVGYGDCLGDGDTYNVLMPPGDYKVRFDSDTLRDEWYDDTYDESAAQVVSLAKRATETASATLAPGGAIAGTVTDADGTTPLEGVCVSLYLPSDVDLWVEHACTDSDGAYRFNGLAPRPYLVEFDGPGDYIDQWATGRDSSESADLVPVSEGQTTPLDAHLARGNVVEGTVSGEGSGALTDACVALLDAVTGAWVADDCTDVDGSYRIGGVPDGTYRVSFFGPYGSAYLDGFWKDAATIDDSTPLELSGQGTVSEIDATLALGSRITGQVLDGVGNPLGDAVDSCLVYVYDLDWNYVGGGCIDDAGNYATSGLPAGDYKVFFEARDSIYGGEWFEGQSDFESATTVTVSTDQDTAGVDARLGPVGPTGSLHGTVTDNESGDAVSGACVLLASDDFRWFRNACADEAGAWSLPSVPEGTYNLRVESVGSPYLVEWWNDAVDFADATPIVVAADDDLALPVSLTRGATVSGVVTDGTDGSPLSNVCVDLIDATTMLVLDGGWRCSDSSGHYVTSGAPAGQYYLRFRNTDGRYGTQLYSGGQQGGSAVQLSLSDQEPRKGVDQALVFGGKLTGTITMPTEADYVGACVEIYDENQIEVTLTCPEDTGVWESERLAPGTYRIQYVGDGMDIEPEWYDGQASYEAATPVTVTADRTTRDLDAELALVTPPSNQAPTANDVSADTAFETSVTVNLEGTDPDGDELTYSHTSPSHGSLSGSGASLTYTPATGYDGPDSFDYTVTDPSDEHATATVSVTVRAAVTDPGTGGGGTGGGTGTGGTGGTAAAPAAARPPPRRPRPQSRAPARSRRPSPPSRPAPRPRRRTRPRSRPRVPAPSRSVSTTRCRSAPKPLSTGLRSCSTSRSRTAASSARSP